MKITLEDFKSAHFKQEMKTFFNVPDSLLNIFPTLGCSSFSWKWPMLKQFQLSGYYVRHRLWHALRWELLFMAESGWQYCQLRIIAMYHNCSLGLRFAASLKLMAAHQRELGRLSLNSCEGRDLQKSQTRIRSRKREEEWDGKCIYPYDVEASKKTSKGNHKTQTSKF